MVKAPKRIDLGCGPNKKAGFYGVDVHPFPGVDLVFDLKKKWPWKNKSVEEYHCSHTIEHFTAMERAHVVNEMYRTLIPGGKVSMIFPYGMNERAYGDPTHQWPPVVTFWFYYLNKEWRGTQAPHCNDIYKCDFDVTWGYIMHPEWQQKSRDTMQFAISWYVNAIMDVQATLTRKG